MNVRMGECAKRRLRDVLLIATGFCLTALLTGCASTRTIQSDGVTRWSGLGVTLPLPAGTWRVTPAQDGAGAHFERAEPRVELLLVRRPARKGESDWMALNALFLSFRDKKESGRWSVARPDGIEVEGRDYQVVENGLALPVRAAAIRRGEWMYDLAEWNCAGRSEIAGLLARLIFDPAAPPPEGKP
jgi:hypothetical protein